MYLSYRCSWHADTAHCKCKDWKFRAQICRRQAKYLMIAIVQDMSYSDICGVNNLYPFGVLLLHHDYSPELANMDIKFVGRKLFMK